ncbi:MAG: MFS transporter [Chloroflexi bacterium]|nr:MFS transporter [Chloroflexota bacterium]
MQNPEQPVPQNWATRFFTIFTGQTISLFGSSLVQFALIWYLTQKTGSATVLATASLFAMLPQILLGPIAGTVVDRGNRRLIMIASDATIALSTLGLAFLFWTGRVEIWHIYAISIIRSLGGAFHYPAMAASTTLMAPKEQLARISGANQAVQGLVSIVAPPVAAFLIAVMTTESILMIDVVTALMGIVPLLFFAVPQPARAAHLESAPPKSFMQDLGAGFKYMASWPGLLMLGLMATLLNFLLAPTGALMPLLVTKYFGKGAIELGGLESAFGIGMIVGGVALGIWGGFKRKIVTSLMGIVVFSIAILGIAIAPPDMFWIVVVAQAVVGVMLPMANGPIHALFQTLVEPDMQGRVMSLLGSVAQAMMPISLLVAGPVSDALGLQTWFWVAGILCLIISVGGFFVPAIYNIEENHHKNQPQAETVPVA